MGKNGFSTGRVRRLSHSLLLISALLFSGSSAFAQENNATGKVEGLVTTIEGVPLPGATVIVTNRATKQRVPVTCDKAGKYLSPELPAGDYVVDADVKGYESPKVFVALQPGNPARADFHLARSAVVVNNETATVQGTLQSEQIDNLPWNGRNFLQLGELEPGVQDLDADALAGNEAGLGATSINSSRGRTTRLHEDGTAINNEITGGPVLNIPLGAIEEFTVTQSLAPLSEVNASAGAVDVITRSGKNDVHGQAFGFFRDADAGNANLPGSSNAPWSQQEFGGNLGGALIKDKLFAFVAAERNRRDEHVPVVEGAPFFGRSATLREPFREVDATGRLDYRLSETSTLFYRFSFDQNSDITPFASGPSMQPFLGRINTPAHTVGLDFKSGSYIHSLRFEYLKYRNAISDRSFQVFGPANPIPGATINIGGGATNQCEPGSLFCSGPSYLGPQQNLQSDTQFRYDGSHMWRSHQFRYGVGFNRILAGGFANLYATAPTLSDSSTVALPASPILGSTGDPTDPLNYPVEWAFLGNGAGFATEKSQFGFPGGGQQDNRLSAYISDTIKAKPNLTVTYGLGWIRDTGVANSDLAAISQLNAWESGLGNRVRQPNANFAPQLGVAWDPGNGGKTSIRGGIGLYYDSSLLQNARLDRALRQQQGNFLTTPAVCIGGAPGRIQWPTTPVGPIAGGVVNSDGTVSPTWCGASMGLAAPQAVALEQAYQSAAAMATSNPTYIGNANAFAGPNQNGLSLLAPNYQTPRTVQMNIGLQHEFRPGLVFTADYLRQVTTRTLLGIDVNHSGEAGSFDLANAVVDRDTAQLANGCAPGTNQVGCMVTNLGPAGALAAYGAAGIGGPAQVTGGTPCPFCAFPGIHPSLGVNVMQFPSGRAVFSAFDLSLKQQLVNFAPGISHAFLQISYSRSRYNAQASDSELANVAPDYANPTRFTGPSDLDRKNQYSIGGHFDLPHSLSLGLIGRFASPLPLTLRYQQNAGAAEVLVTDWTGDGTTGDIIPGSNVGSYMRNISATGLSKFISTYNQNTAGAPTPAGSALINGGVFSQSELQAMGAVLQPLAAPVQDPTALSWLKTVDIRVSWKHTLMDRVVFEPSVGIFNLFNFANFDLPGYTQSGYLNFLSGASVSQPATLLQPQGTVGGTSANAADPFTGRINRSSLGSGTFAPGAPRSFEFGVKISF